MQVFTMQLWKLYYDPSEGKNVKLNTNSERQQEFVYYEWYTINNGDNIHAEEIIGQL